MSVTVRTTRTSGGEKVKVEHENGHTIEVWKDGHLGVINSRGGAVAIYAPGQWIDAVRAEAKG